MKRYVYTQHFPFKLEINVPLFLPSSQIGRNSLENTLLKYGAKDYFFKASICLFCKGPVEAKVCDCVHFHLCMKSIS